MIWNLFGSKKFLLYGTLELNDSQVCIFTVTADRHIDVFLPLVRYNQLVLKRSRPTKLDITQHKFFKFFCVKVPPLSWVDFGSKKKQKA
jgi:hypothetical protein